MIRPHQMLSLKKISSLQHRCFISKKLSHLTILQDLFDIKNEENEKGLTRSQNVGTFYSKLLGKIYEGGGDRAIKRHTITNKKLLIRERLKRILDEGSPVLEIAPLAGTEMSYGDIPTAGSVCFIGKIHGRFCILGGNDATVKGGAVYPIGVQKQLRCQSLSSINHLPGIHLVDSAGAFLPLQADIFPDRNHGGRVFRNEAVLSSKGLPQVALVAGSSTAGAAYVPTMTEEAIIVKGIGTIFLGGPPLVKAATGEIVTEQELGGADMHCRASGCTDYYAETEMDAFEMCRDTIETLNWLPPETIQKPFSQPLYNTSALEAIAGKSCITKHDIYTILSRILDGSLLKEFKKEFGQNLITGFAYINGHLVGVIANCGPISSGDAQKGAHFITLCDRRALPIVFLQNSLGNNQGAQMWNDGAVLKERAKMVAAHSCVTVPKIVLNIGGCLQDDNFTMCGGCFKPNFIFSWPLAHTSFEAIPQREQLLDTILSLGDYRDLLFQETTSAFHLSSHVLQDGIVLPQETRSVLAFCIEVAKAGIQNQTTFNQRKIKVPIFRM